MAAPSVIGQAFPAVIVPVNLSTIGFNLANASIVCSARGPMSSVITSLKSGSK